MQAVAYPPLVLRQTADALEAEYGMVLADVAKNAAWFLTMREQLGPQDVTALMGPDNVQGATAMINQTRELVAVADMMDSGAAFLLPWQTTEEGEHVAVVRSEALAELPAGAELGAWQIAAGIAVGVLLVGVGAYVLVRHWETDVRTLQMQNAELELRIIDRIQANADALLTTDPERAARISEANAKALAAQATALRNPKSWLDQAFGTASRIAESTIPPLAWIIGLYVLSQSNFGKRAA